MLNRYTHKLKSGYEKYNVKNNNLNASISVTNVSTLQFMVIIFHSYLHEYLNGYSLEI